MKYLIIGLAAVIILIAGLSYWLQPASQLPADGKLRIVTEGVYPPFNMRNSEGELIGFDIDIANAICDRLKIGCTIVAHDWEDIIIGIMTKKYDVIINGMSITEARKQWLAFSNPYYKNPLAFIAANAAQIKTKNNLRNKTIGVHRATVSSNYLEAADNFNIVHVVRYDTQQGAWEALTAGKVDAVLSDQLLGYHWLNTHPDYSFVGEPINIGDKVGIAFRKQDKALLKRFNRALEQILEDGTYTEINRKYFPFSIYE